jgi:hypothetical protein
VQTKLITLNDVAPRPRVVRNGRETEPFNQWQLREYLRSLVDAYGYRDDFRGTSPPWRVPYIPLPFAGQMLRYFGAQGRFWLDKDIPDGAKQPRFIKVWLKKAAQLVGEIDRDGKVTAAAGDNFEDAPAAVASKAPTMFRSELAAGKAHPQVMKAAETWRFIDALTRLAIHFDALSGQPTKLDLIVESVKEQAGEMAGAVDNALEAVGAFPLGKVLKWTALGALGLGAIYVVSR